MGSGLIGCGALLKALAAAYPAGAGRGSLMASLRLPADEISLLCSELNAIDPIIEIRGDTIALKRPLSLLDEAYIYKNARGRGRVEVLDCIDSTNTECLRRADNLTSGDVLLAEIQTAGRGRRNGRWYSPIGASLAFSLCHVFSGIDKLKGLSVAAGCAVAGTLESLGLTGLKVKWPNDVYVGEAKLCGILVESVPQKPGIAAVIGVGLNVQEASISSLKREVASLSSAGGRRFDRNEVAVALISKLREVCARFEREGLSAHIAYLNAHDGLKGRNVTLELEGQTVTGTAAGINPDGALILYKDGKSAAYNSGHIVGIS